MKLLTFRENDRLHVGIKLEEGILDVEKVVASVPHDEAIPVTMKELMQTDRKSIVAFIERVRMEGIHDFVMSEAELVLGPAVESPGKIICVGLNYKKHAYETNMPIPESPILFNKYNNALAGHEGEITLPRHAYKYDYEAELAIVIGKEAKEVSKEDALDYVFGYTAANDLSARDLQFRTNQWLLGKSLDGFCPIGPYLVSTDEITEPNHLHIQCSVNGEVRQDSNTSDMIFHCDDIISYISHYMTLEPGDVILTGTPEGVTTGYPEEKQDWLVPGDEVTIEIEKIGKLRNRMK